MIGEIEKIVKSVRVLIDKYNVEFDLIKEVMTKSVPEKIREVREEERKQAEDAIKNLALEHQAASEQAEERYEAAIKPKKLQ